MSDTRTAPTASSAAHLSRRVRSGLVICILIGLAGVVPVPTGGNAGPPAPVIVLDILLGLLQVGGAVLFWRTGRRVALRVAAGALILNAITALPAFFVDVDAWVKILVAIVTLLAITALLLMLGRPRTAGLD